MIITCGECNSSFVLDDSLIKVSGSKVRCSNCKYVFVVYPAANEPEPVAVPEKPVAPQAKAKTGDVMPKAVEKAAAAVMDDDPDLSKALDAINEDELDFTDDELGIDTSAVAPVAVKPPVSEPEVESAASEPDVPPEIPTETPAESKEMDIEASLDEEEEDILDFSDFELDMDESDVPSDVPEIESGVTQELDLEFDEKMVMDDFLGDSDLDLSVSDDEEELDFSDLELELGGESEASAGDMTKDLLSKGGDETSDSADTVVVDEDNLDFSDLDLDGTGDDGGFDADLDLDLDEESDAEPETMMIEEELDFSDLERELGGDESDDLPASEEDLDLDLDLDDDISAEPETVLLDEEDLDFSEFELDAEDDGDKAKQAKPLEESLDDELDFSDLAGILDSDEELEDLPEDDEDVELELDLDSDDGAEPEAKGAHADDDEEELDFSDLENLLDGIDDIEETKVEALPEDIDLELDGDLDEDELGLETDDEEEHLLSEEDDLDFSDVEAMLGSDDEEDEDLDLDLDLGGAESDSGFELEEEEDEQLSLSLENEDDSDIELELDLSEDQSSHEEEDFEDVPSMPALADDEADEKEAKAADKKKGKKPAPKRKAKGKGGIVKKLIIALILIILVVFVLYMSKNKIEDMTDMVIPVNVPILEDLRNTIGGMDIPFVSPWVKPEPKDPQGKLQLKTSGITGKIIVSETLGDLFVISGKVQNNYSATRNSISLVGKLFGQGGKVVQSKLFYAGNVIPEEELATMNEDLIKKRLQNRLGDNGVNAKVRPGQMVPFMVVFTNLNENLTEFSVEAGGSFQGAAIK